jgi:phosphoribosylformylglycinamidine cyclo-ligase
VAESVVDGMAKACRENSCARLGGETAEMPGFYADGEYDLAGFIVGAVERDQLLTGRGITPGDVLIGIPSSGLHTNGYSLARRIVFEQMKLAVDAVVPELGHTVADALLEPHRSYLQMIQPLLAAQRIKGMAHITGGGITDNLPRVLPHGTAAQVNLGSWEVPALFRWLQAGGQVPGEDMLRTFNMGVGLILVASKAHADVLLDELAARGGHARVIGSIVPGDGEPAVRYTGTL